METIKRCLLIHHVSWQPRLTDSEFVRRVHLDVTGLLPTPNTVRTFLDDHDVNKRSRLIDELLESPEHAKFMAQKWGDLNLSQALALSNGSYVQGKITNGNCRTRRLLKGKRPHREIVENCYLAAYSRKPTDDEFETFQAYLSKAEERSVEQSFEDLVWGLINSNEFLFQH